jgi:hypothetical protein
MLLGIVTDGTSEPIFGVNFTCIIKYNDNDGWTVKCNGTIPQNVYSSLNSIACRPTTGNETVDKEVEISYQICRGKYILYICIQSILYHFEGPSWSWWYGSWIYNYL